ncbi:GNAT family N-acetyltransferase [Winogradskyella sp.]|uniref:GNAT family N-acetyltransferase n=1 Tax=Winogradskyella sp. TaxID=1883156 RepID=UPI0025E6CCFC|nr:GNAT family N-acetyltransferase [Winogradskyella sp.]
MEIINVTPQNAKEETFFCIKDIKKSGFESKQKWFEKRYNEGLQLKILKDNDQKMIGFIEFTEASKAWRPVNADGYMFIHCMVVQSKKDRNKGYGALLINEAEKEAKKNKMSGLCVMTSKGSWIANKTIFEKHGFSEVDRRGRFELLSKKWDDKAVDPTLIDWTLKQKNYNGWHLVYADQCPWHDKSAFDLLNTAMDYGIDLKLTKLESAEQAKNAPSGYGVFSILHNGKLIEDHYISATRFKNILKKEIHSS